MLNSNGALSAIFEPTSLSVGSSDGNANTFQLFANSPNPFNHSTTIGFWLPVDADVNLTMYNALGQQIVTFADGRFDAGYHRVVFDASHLASGVYLCRFQSGSSLLTRRMIYLK